MDALFSKFDNSNILFQQMTVVEAYAGGKKIDPPDSNSQLSPMLSSLLTEGIAQNSNGSVYVPAVCLIALLLFPYGIIVGAFSQIFF